MSTSQPLDRPASCISRQRVIEINARAWRYWCWRAHQPGAWTRDYLAHRGLPHLDAGHAPRGWDRARRALNRSGFTDDELLAAGLLRRTSSGTLIDTFRDRLVLPIRDGDDAIIGFTARRHPVLDSDPDTRAPKYLNTTTTPAFDKSRVLYGLDRNATATLDTGEGRAVIVEGALDAEAVRSLHGPLVTVAPCGTAFTSGHVQVLANIHAWTLGEAVITFDPDAAGQTATRRLWEVLPAAVAAQIHAARLPVDPAQMVQDGRADELARLLASAPRYIDLLVDDHLEHLAPTVEEQLTALQCLAVRVARLDAYTLGEVVERLSDGYRSDPRAWLAPPSVVEAFINAHEARARGSRSGIGDRPRTALSARGGGMDVGPSPPRASVRPPSHRSAPAAER